MPSLLVAWVVLGFHVPAGSGGLVPVARHAAHAEEEFHVFAGIGAYRTLLPGLVESTSSSVHGIVFLPADLSVGVEVSPFERVRGAALFARWHHGFGRYLWFAPLAGVQFHSGRTGRVGVPSSAGEESNVFEGELRFPAVDLGVSLGAWWRYLEVTAAYSYAGAYLAKSSFRCVPDHFGPGARCSGQPTQWQSMPAWLDRHVLTFALRLGPPQVGARLHLSWPLTTDSIPAGMDAWLPVGADLYFGWPW